ncbi:MAG: GNAT family N-acetyltransferase [Betaproteobacteria bacterium]|nr:GNAT family N-acetyltransferase [Betaproteobacteria bacterium]
MGELQIESRHSADAIPAADWACLTPPDEPFLNRDFFSILECRGAAAPAAGWTPCHWVAHDGDRIHALMPTYVKGHSHGDFTGDWSWAGAYRQFGKAYYPKLHSGLPHTPASGPRLLVAPGADPDECLRALTAAVKAGCARMPWSSWHVALPAASQIDLFRAQGFLVSHDVQFHWRDAGYGDFDGYLATFSSARRRKVRAERRRVGESGLAVDIRHGDEIEPAEWPRLHALYAATFAKFGNFAALTAATFAELSASLGRRMVVFIARRQEMPVAVSICFRSADTLYGRYWGSDGEYPALHFELCLYQGIAYCLREGLSTFEPGAGGEHKIARGFAPVVVSSCHWIEDAGMRQLIARHLGRQREAVLAYAEAMAAHLPFRRDQVGPETTFQAVSPAT